MDSQIHYVQYGSSHGGKRNLTLWAVIYEKTLGSAIQAKDKMVLKLVKGTQHKI